MALKQVTVTAVLVFDDEHTAGPDDRAVIELFEPAEHGPEAVVPVDVHVTESQAYYGERPEELR